MSLKLKINILLLLCMAVSTGYFLHRIDQYEEILAIYRYQQNNPPKVDLGEIFDDKELTRDIKTLKDPNRKILREETFLAIRSIESSYRYLIAINTILMITIIVITKTFRTSKYAG